MLKLHQLYPVKFRNSVKELLIFADLTVDYNIVLSGVFSCSMLISAICSSVLAVLLNSAFYLFSILVFFFLCHLLFFSLLALKADNRARNVEKFFPDALHAFAINLKSGLPPEKALLLSTQPEFGILADELCLISSKVAMGEKLSTALLSIKLRVNSKIISKSVDMISFSIESGGRLSELMESTSQQLRQQRLTAGRIRSEVSSYIYFILSAVALGTPLLYALNTVLTKVVISTTNNLSTVSSYAKLPITLTSTSVNYNFVFGFAIFAIIIRTIMGCYAVGLISQGKGIRGLKYIPVTLIVALSIFMLIRAVMLGMMGSFGLGG